MKSFTKTKANRLGEGGLYPTEKVLNSFAEFAFKRNYHQILFEFGKQYLEVCLTFHEDRNEFLVCKEIILETKAYNENKGTNIEIRSWNIRD